MPHVRRLVGILFPRICAPVRAHNYDPGERERERWYLHLVLRDMLGKLQVRRV